MQLEQRLQNGLKYAEDYHSSKYNVLKTDMDEQKQQHEDQINKMRAEYEEKLTIMRSSYTTALDSMKSDQLAAIETIRQTKLIEFATVQDSTSYLQSLKSASNNLSEATENLQMIRTNMEANVERLHTEKEIQLTAREQRLNGNVSLNYTYNKCNITFNSRVPEVIYEINTRDESNESHTNYLKSFRIKS